MGDGGVVKTGGGRVRGDERAGIWCFAGIPYAAAPTGPLRWRPPQPPASWTGVRDATEFGPIAPQPPPIPGFAIPGDPEHQSEDCLSVNVWTPGCDDARRPVMVWLHGGSFTGGAGSSLLYRGNSLARHGGVVVVTCNYRLGALGFLAHPALDDAGAGMGNWGVWDQVAVLRWVRDNVAGFGGDPGQVTVFGESAGGMSVAALLAAPAARGLFHRAIVQSGPPYTHTAERATARAEEVGRALGLRELTRRALEDVPAAELVAAVAQLAEGPPTPGELPLPLLPVVDGTLLDRPPAEAVAAGAAAHVPLLIGTTRDELSMFALGDQRVARLDGPGVVRWVGKAAPFVGDPEAAVETYRRVRAGRGEPDDPRSLWVAIGSDLVFRWPTLRLAAAQRRHQAATFVYLFTWETPIFGGVLGSCHALEIPFVFGAVRRRAIAIFSGGGPEAEALSDRMLPAWAAFARAGDPSHEGLGDWRAWDPERRSTMVFGRRSGLEERPRDEELAVWERDQPFAADPVPA